MTRGRASGHAARGLAVALGALVAIVALAPPARAEFDWPARIPLPHHDIAVGLSGGIVIGEDLGDSARHRPIYGLAGLDVSWLHGLFGLHLGLHAHPEGTTTRVGGTLEASVWYVVMLGIGASYGVTTGDGDPDVPHRARGLSFFVGVPIPIARLGAGHGALVLVPYVRPGVRFIGRGDLAGFHQAGVQLRWTSFSFRARPRE
ncbi:MAG: hypothetical protein H6744_15270 [Deltaproteobacteria bacterium]|nr:hypothetical protein [Deltaproteobacteria bacterium]MCB9788042.1 hypothetical protein [Deltaproteobacteria bacterium]